MAPKSGKSGQIESAGVPLVRLNQWDISIVSDTHDVTVFSTSTGAQWREFVQGLQSWSGSAAGFADVTGSTSQNDVVDSLLGTATGAIVAVMDKAGGDNFAGNVFWSGADVSAPIDGTIDITLNFQGNGALSHTTTT